MGVTPNEDLLKAAFITDYLTAGGLLLPEQDRFIDMVIENSVIAPLARVEKMNSPVKYIEKIGFGSRIMRAATEAVAPTGTEVPTTSRVILTTKEVIAAVDLSYSTLEDNVDRAQLKEHLMSLIAARAAVDLEELYLKGDTQSGDSYFALFNGWLKLATSHTVNTSSASKGTEVLSSMLAAMPAKYLRSKKDCRFFVSTLFDQAMRESLAQRSTGAGDKYLLEDVPLLYGGIPVVPVDMMTARAAILVNPQNLLIGIQRDISIEIDPQPRKRIFEVTLTARVACNCEEEAAMVVTTTCPALLG